MRKVLLYIISMIVLAVSTTAFAEQQGGDLEKAKEVFEKLLVLTPKDPDVRRYLADIYEVQGQYDKAMEFYRDYSNMMPNDYYPHYRMGDILKVNGNADEARAEYQKAIELVDSTSEDIFVNIAEARINALLGKKDVSDAMFEKLKKKSPESSAVASSQIDTLLDTNRNKDAHEVAKMAIVDFPENLQIKKGLARSKINLMRFGEASPIVAELRKAKPNDKGIAMDYAYLNYEMGNWKEAAPIVDEFARMYPTDRWVRELQDAVFQISRPTLFSGFNFRWLGDEKIFGPYFNYYHPINSRLWFEANYTFNRDSANIPDFDPSYSVFTNRVDLLVGLKPHYTLKLKMGVANQFYGKSYVPGAILGVIWEKRPYGKAEVSYEYDMLFDDPTSALYFDGNQDDLSFNYENVFYERAILQLSYDSIWYRVNGSKTNTGGGGNYGRQDVAGGVLQFILLKKPQIRIGYGFNYMNLHLANNYLAIIPLISQSQFHSIRYGFTYDWKDKLFIDFGGFVGADTKRNLTLKGLDLYGFSITNRIKVSKRVEIQAGAEYSTEALTNTTGRYINVDLGFLYRF